MNEENTSTTNAVAPSDPAVTAETSKRKIREERTDSAEDFILREVRPRLRGGIACSVPQVGCDDPEELLQDGLVIALRMLRSARRVGKRVSANNLAYFTLCTLRTGRRSTGVHRNDALNPAAQLSGHSRVHSFDEMVTAGDLSDEPLTLGEVLACKQDDPATEAARKLDWRGLGETLDAVTAEILAAFLSGTDLTLLVPQLKRSRSALQNDKRRLAILIREHLGEDILVQIQERPGWRNNIAASRERTICRWQRQARSS